MKKLINLLLVIIITCSVLSGCGNNEVNEYLKEKVLNDYLIWSGFFNYKSIDEIECEFYGQYDESVAVYFHTSGAYETPIVEKVAGLKFKYPDSRVIRIWNNGKFYTMTEAYELGLIDKSDVVTIKLKSLLVRVQEPAFIYEEKEYNTPDFSIKSLTYEAIEVVLDKGISEKKTERDYDFGFFGGIEIAEIIEIGAIDLPHNDVVIIVFPRPLTQEEMLQVFDILYKIDGIKEVEPIYPAQIWMSPND